MKKTVFKMLGVIMALCVFLGVLPMSAVANDDVELYGMTFAGRETVEDITAIEFNPETEITVPEKDNTVSDQFFANQFYGSTADTPYLFYNQLNDAQKVVYDVILANPLTQEITVSFPEMVIGMGATAEEALNALKAGISEIVIAGISAVAEDNPIVFWMKGFGYGFNYYTGANDSIQLAGVQEINLTISYDTVSYSSFDDIIIKTNLLAQEVENFEVNGINRHEKVKSIHDKLCELITYPDQQGTFSDGSPYYGKMVHEPTGALLSDATYGNGHYAVCEGYAEAFKLICDREGIPCITVVGTGNGGAHKWNYVKMEDNKWYLLDATWNDQGSSTYNSYLLIGTDTKAPYFEPNTPDSSVHIPTGQMYSGVDFELIYPTLSANNYCYLFLAPNVKDFSFDTERNVCLVGKDTDFFSAFEWYESDGITVGISSLTSISNHLNIRDADTEEQKMYLTVARRGNVNGLGGTNADDYTELVKISSTQATVADNSVEFYAGDMTQDGAIDGFDAIALELYLNGDLVFD